MKAYSMKAYGTKKLPAATVATGAEAECLRVIRRLKLAQSHLRACAGNNVITG